MTQQQIPSLNYAIQNAASVPDCIRNQIEYLKKKDDLVYSIFANQLETYLEYITDRDMLGRQRTHFDNFYQEIDKSYPDLLFRLEGRRKSFISAYKKLWTSSPDVPLKDVSAFRITLFGENPNELIEMCYTVLEHLIKYNVAKGYMPCHVSIKDTQGFKKEDHPDVVVPDKSYLSEDTKRYVKDYIFHPKKNGYQSLHIFFRDEDGNYFEVQIRTIFMHFIAEGGSADHEAYKKSEYGYLDLDRKSIKIPGYYIREDNRVLDWVGFEESLEILRRQKTY